MSKSRDLGAIFIPCNVETDFRCQHANFEVNLQALCKLPKGQIKIATNAGKLYIRRPTIYALYQWRIQKFGKGGGEKNRRNVQ
jgi:hypothetical protein